MEKLVYTRITRCSFIPDNPLSFFFFNYYNTYYYFTFGEFLSYYFHLLFNARHFRARNTKHGVTETRIDRYEVIRPYQKKKKTK